MSEMPEIGTLAAGTEYSRLAVAVPLPQRTMRLPEASKAMSPSVPALPAPVITTRPAWPTAFVERFIAHNSRRVVVPVREKCPK